MKDGIKFVVVLTLNLGLFVFAMLNIISAEAFLVSLGSLAVMYYSFEFIGN